MHADVHETAPLPPPFVDDLAAIHQHYCVRVRSFLTMVAPLGLFANNLATLRPCGKDYIWTWARQLPFPRKQLVKCNGEIKYNNGNDFMRIAGPITHIFTWHIRRITLVRYRAPETLQRELISHYGIILEFYDWDGLVWRAWRELEHYYRAAVLLAIGLDHLPRPEEHFRSDTYYCAHFNHWK